MKTPFALIFPALVLAACSQTPNNTEGKDFDANSRYCEQLRMEAEGRSAGPSFVTPNVMPPNPQDERYDPQTQRERAQIAYAKDCESRSGANKREP